VADSGQVAGTVGTLPIQGSGGFLATHTYALSDNTLQVDFGAVASLSTPYTYLSAGAQATSTLTLQFRLTEDTPFTLFANLTGATGDAVSSAGTVQSPVARGTVILRRVGSTQGGWVFDALGTHQVSGILPSDSYELYTNAFTKVNGELNGSTLLVLGPVPEPATVVLWLAGLAGLGALVRRRAAAGAGLALVTLAVAPAQAAGTSSIGEATFYTGYELYVGTRPDVGDSALNRSPTDATGGAMATIANLGTRKDGQFAFVGGSVLNHGRTYDAIADSPWMISAPGPDTVVGGRGWSQVNQSFVRNSESSSLNFIYTAGQMLMFNEPEFGAGCADDCAMALVEWFYEVRRNDAPDQVIATDSQFATLYISNGVLRLSTGRPAGAEPSSLGLWQWDCPACDRSVRGQSSASLVAPFIGVVDLSSIPYDPTPGATQVEFTVTFEATAWAFTREGFWGASAYARDPLGDSGVALEASGLLATNNPVLSPVPEPAPALLLALGLAVLGPLRRWRARA
jgi:hypothetical protein